MNTKPQTNEEIQTIATVDLDDVTGGCAACGCGNPSTAAPANPGTSNRGSTSPFQFPFSRR